jgi:hypothetical protein
MPAEVHMSRFLLLLRDEPSTFEHLSPAEMQAIIQKYIAWGNGLRDSGRLIGSDKLTGSGGRVARQSGAKTMVTDGPFTEAREVVGGFYMIQAKDYDEAMTIVRDCPHLAFGSIEVRQVEELQR